MTDRTRRSELTDRLTYAFVAFWTCVRHPVAILQFRRKLGVWPHIAVPQTVSDKSLWRKLFDRNPLFVTLCDKLATKAFFADRCPDLPVPETLWIGNDALDIPDELLAQPVAIKVNAGSGWNVVLPVPPTDANAVKRKCDRWMRGPSYGWRHGEWAYTKVKRRIFVERLVYTESGSAPTNILVNAFAGKVPLVYVWIPDPHDPYSKSPGRQGCSFTPDGVAVPPGGPRLAGEFVPLPDGFRLPKAFWAACRYAEALSRDLDFCRFDFLCGEDVLYGCEATVYPMAGYNQYSTPVPPRLLNDAWDLRRSWFLQARHRGWRSAYAAALVRTLGRL